MKISTIKSIAMGVLLALGTTSFAQNVALKVSPYINSDKSIISVLNPTHKSVRFELRNTKGELVYRDWLGSDASAQSVANFYGIEDGNYTAKLLIKGEEVASEQFALVNAQVSDSKVLSEEELKTLIRLNDNILYISHIATGGNSFSVSIEDEMGDKVYEKDIDGQATYSGKYDITALPNGNYSVKVNSGGSQKSSYAFTK